MHVLLDGGMAIKTHINFGRQWLTLQQDFKCQQCLKRWREQQHVRAHVRALASLRPHTRACWLDGPLTNWHRERVLLSVKPQNGVETLP